MAALAAPYLDGRGADVVVLLAKASFVQRAGALVRAERQTPVRTTDVPTDPATVEDGRESSLRFPSDVGCAKPGADVVVLGDAIASRRVASLEVAVKTPERTVTLRVHGPRTYQRGFAGLTFTAAVPVERAPLTFEHAWGGTSRDGTVVDWRNPVGRGIHASTGELDGAPAPTIEDPAQPLEASRPSAPVGFGAIPIWWQPRRDLVGTMDAAWQKTRMPVAPLDQDPRCHQVAHPALQMRRPLLPGDVLATLGLSREAFHIAVPPLRPRVHIRRSDGSKTTVRLELDLAILEPEHARVELTFRGVVNLGRGSCLLREARLDDGD